MSNLAPKEDGLTAMIQDWDGQLTKVGELQDKAAFAALFEHFAPLLKSFLMSGTNLNGELAEDLVQDTMIKVWRRAPSFNADHGSASAWIYAIARNTRIDWYRKQAKRGSVEVSADDIYGNQPLVHSPDIPGGETMPTPYTSLVAKRQADVIQQRLGELPQEQSQALRLMYFQGLSGAQVATALKIPLGTVKSRIRLALQKLNISLAPQAGATSEGHQHD